MNATTKHDAPCDALKAMRSIIATIITVGVVVSGAMLKFSYEINSKMARLETKVENIEKSLDRITVWTTVGNGD